MNAAEYNNGPSTNDAFDPDAFLASVGEGRSMMKPAKGGIIFSQGEPATEVLYLKKGKVKLATVSAQGKEAVVAILGSGNFFGEGCLAGQPLRISTSAATWTVSASQSGWSCICNRSIRLLADWR